MPFAEIFSAACTDAGLIKSTIAVVLGDPIPDFAHSLDCAIKAIAARSGLIIVLAYLPSGAHSASLRRWCR